MTLKVDNVRSAISALEGVSLNAPAPAGNALAYVDGSVGHWVYQAIEFIRSWPIIGDVVTLPLKPILWVFDQVAGSESQIRHYAHQLRSEGQRLASHADECMRASRVADEAWDYNPGSESAAQLLNDTGAVLLEFSNAMDVCAKYVEELGDYVGASKATWLNDVAQLGQEIAQIVVLWSKCPPAAIFRALMVIKNTLTKIRSEFDQLHGLATGLLGQVGHVRQGISKASQLLIDATSNVSDMLANPTNFSTDSMRSATPHRDDAEIVDVQAALQHDKELPNGWRRLRADELARMGLNLPKVDDETGFGAEVAYDTRTGRIVCQFNQTDTPSLTNVSDAVKDWKEDLHGALTVSHQSAKAIAVADAFEAAGLGDRVIYSGNSLGGRLAAVAALSSENGVAVTTNAAGVSQPTLEYLAHRRGMDAAALAAEATGGSVRAYYLDGEALTVAQQDVPYLESLAPDAPGAQFKVPTTELTRDMWFLPKHGAIEELAQEMRNNWHHMK